MNANDVLSVISYSIKQVFPDLEINKESVIQDLPIPSIYIGIVDAENKQQLGKRYTNRFSAAIKYFPSSADINQECYLVADKLTSTVEIMKYKDMVLRGIKIRYQVTDKVLHFYFEVNSTIQKCVEVLNEMQRLEVNENVRS